MAKKSIKKPSKSALYQRELRKRKKMQGRGILLGAHRGVIASIEAATQSVRPATAAEGLCNRLDALSATITALEIRASDTANRLGFGASTSNEKAPPEPVGAGILGSAGSLVSGIERTIARATLAIDYIETQV